MFKKLFTGLFYNLFYQAVSLIVLVSLAFGVMWAYAAFVEPSAAPSASNQDFTQNILGANNADNSFDSSSVAANIDGSIVERLEYLWSNRASFGTGTALDSEVGNASDAASMATTLFAGQQYLWDNRTSFGGSSWTQCAHFADTAGDDISATWDDSCVSYQELLFACSYSAGGSGWADAFYIVPSFLGLTETSGSAREFTSHDDLIVRASPNGGYIDVYIGSVYKFYVTNSGTGAEEGLHCGGNAMGTNTGDEYWIYGR